MPEPQRVRVLFVDDDPSVLNLLRAAISALRREWDGFLAANGEEALDLLSRQPIDLVISDMRMPGISGCELLNRMMRSYPDTARIIMSGFADEESVLASVGAAHQYLSKPFELQTLRAIIARIHRLRQRLQAGPVRELAARISSIPSIPETYFEMLEAMRSADSPLEELAGIISRDPAMTAKLLQLVNSAFFGFARECSNVSDAIQMLGVVRVRALALGIQMFSAFDPGRVHDFNLDAVWKHSLHTGFLARLVAQEEGGHQEVLEHAFAAGLMHDIGKLALAANLPDLYATICSQARQEKRPLFVVERERLGATHADLGGHLLGLWGLPSPLVESVANHHNPSDSQDDTFTVTTAVHVANVLAHEHAKSQDELPLNPLDSAYLKRLGLDHRLDHWRSLLATTRT